MLSLRRGQLPSVARWMCRIFSVIFLVLAALVISPAAYPQDSGDFAREFFRRLDEKRQREQRQRDQELERQIAPHWRACELGDVAACQRAAQFPLNPHGRALLYGHYQRAESMRAEFDGNWHSCADGNVTACDAALSYPFTTDRATLLAWRSAAIESVRREHERREAARREAEERTRVQKERQPSSAEPVTNNHSALSTQTTPIPLRFPSIYVPPDLLIGVILLLSLLYLLPLRFPAPLTSSAAFGSFLVRLIKRQSTETHSPPQEPRAMLDDRELLGATRSPWLSRASGGSDPATRQVMTPGNDRIRVKVRRSQASSFAGKVTFSVNFIADLSPEAREAVRRYKFGKTVLYQKDPKLDFSVNIFRYISRLLWLMLTRKRWQITISDLVDGRTIECKDILEVLDVEDRITGAAKTFASVLRAASWFGGEEIVEL